MKPIVLTGLLLLIAGCGKTYQSVAIENLKMQPDSYNKKQITITGIPSPPQRGDFSSPTPYTTDIGHLLSTVSDVQRW